jgi:3-methyl-2-oxobutanoate hydroxymethyltransferase
MCAKPTIPAGGITLSVLSRMKRAAEKIACLTCYDASFAKVLEAAGVEVILVGDSLGMVIEGHDSTLPVSVADMVYHASCVARGSTRALRVVDMPFMSYATPAQALGNAARLMREGGAQLVKLEGGAVVAEAVSEMVRHGIPVCGHLGLLPQSVHRLGGYHVQGREPGDAARIREDARVLEQAGVSMLILECIPAEVAAQITRDAGVPVIGIGAGKACDGQVLVLYDMLGLTPGKRPRFSRDFLADSGDIAGAVRAYVAAVKTGAFPAPEHCY